LAGQTRFGSRETYTPKHLVQKILSARSALQGERKQVTVLFADLKGSMELLADRDPEEARPRIDDRALLLLCRVHRSRWSRCLISAGIMRISSSDISL
jgi:class 3 adenylate cyclase